MLNRLVCVRGQGHVSGVMRGEHAPCPALAPITAAPTIRIGSMRGHMNMTLAIDLLNPLESSEKRSHKLKRLVQSPNSFFMDVKCPGCFQITTVFSHAQTVVQCSGCATILSQPTGGKARLTEGCSFRRKQN
ncbi:40S ribosomal protein S27 [Chytriomyces hyalinus]|nr:40S ribosomal protein S27 [Chytriomyces hyalinus]